MFINGIPVADGYTHGFFLVRYEITGISATGKQITLYPAPWQTKKEVINDAKNWLKQWVNPQNIIVKH